MSRADKLQARLAGNMSESLGVRLVTNDRQDAAAKAIAKVSPEDGRTRDRLAGHMELDRIVPDPDQPRKTLSRSGNGSSSPANAGGGPPIRRGSKPSRVCSSTAP